LILGYEDLNDHDDLRNDHLLSLLVGKSDLTGRNQGCFDNFDHTWMLENIPSDKDKLRMWLKAGCMENAFLQPTTKGTPQGGISSTQWRYPAASRDHFTDGGQYGTGPD